MACSHKQAQPSLEFFVSNDEFRSNSPKLFQRKVLFGVRMDKNPSWSRHSSISSGCSETRFFKSLECYKWNNKPFEERNDWIYVEIGLNHSNENDWIVGRDSRNSNLIESAILVSLNMNYALHQLHDFRGQKHTNPFTSSWLSFHWKSKATENIPKFSISSWTFLWIRKKSNFCFSKYSFNIYVFISLKLKRDLFMSATNDENLSTVRARVWCEIFCIPKPNVKNMFKRKLLQSVHTKSIWFLVLWDEKGCTCQNCLFQN